MAASGARHRETEYREARAAYEETKSPGHKRWLLDAMRSKDMTQRDVMRAIDDNAERQKDYDRETDKIKRELGVEVSFRTKEEQANG